MTTYWYLTSISERLRQVDLSEPAGLLGPAEAERYSHLKFAKRKTEWLAGRLASKDLLREVIPTARQYSLPELEILSAEGGAPYYHLRNHPDHTGKISISHSNDQVACAYLPGNLPLGIDLEKIEQRGEEFAADYLTPGEHYQVLQCPSAEQAVLVTLLWSAKEAVLKALCAGLRMDTRSIEVECPPENCRAEGWHPLNFNLLFTDKNSLRMWWRREEKFIVTLCLPEDQTEMPVRVEI